MKSILTWTAILVLWTSMVVHGAVYSQGPYTTGFANSGSIPDGNPTGWWDTRTVSGVPAGLTVGAVTVTFTISGGFNGDLVGYLSHNGVLVPLLNRVGMGTGPNTAPTYYFGFSTSGFNNITLDNAASQSIHGVSNPTSGNSYIPDGGNLNSFYGGDPNGAWTIFFADLSGGGGTSQLLSWSLDITAVPEPVTSALGIFAGVVGVVVVGRSRPVRRWVRGRWVAINTWIDAV